MELNAAINKDYSAIYRKLPLLLLIFILLPFPVFAGNISDVICNLIIPFTGLTGKAVASVAVIAIGVGALYNKISWSMAFTIAFGIAIMFGAASIASSLGGPGMSCKATSTAFACNGKVPNRNLFSVVDTSGLSNLQAQDPNNPSAIDVSGGSCAVAGLGFMARTMCIFKSTIGSIMSVMYCSFADYMRSSLVVLFTLLVTIFGIMVMTGTSKATIKEFSTVLFKIALVWAFAMNADWGIGIGYKFFMSMAEEGADIVMTAFPGNGTATLTAPDTVLLNLAGFATESGKVASTWPDIPGDCKVYLIAFGVLLVFFLPMVLMLLLTVIMQYVGLVFKVMLNYLTSLVLVSLLFILAPLFISFSLFKITQKLFEKWIQYLISFSLQMVVMFGFLAMSSLIPIADFFVKIISLLKSYDVTVGVYALISPIEGCGICQYTISGNDISCVARAGATMKQAADAGYILSEDGKYYVSSLWQLPFDVKFVAFFVAQAVAIYIICKIVDDFQKHAGEIAKSLGGLDSAAALGGDSWDTKGASVNYMGLEAFSGAYHGFLTATRNNTNNPFANSYNAFRESEGSLLTRIGAGSKAGFRTGMDSITGVNFARTLRSGIIGEERKVYNLDGSVSTKLEGGFFGGLMHGSVIEEDSLFGRSGSNQTYNKKRKKQEILIDEAVEEYNRSRELTLQNRKDMELARAEFTRIIGSAGGDAAKITAAEQAFNEAKKNYKKSMKNEIKRRDKVAQTKREWHRLKNQQESNYRRGLFDSDNHQGALRDFVNPYGTNDNTYKRFAELQRRQKEQAQYGRVYDLEAQNPDNYYYFLQMPKDVSANDMLVVENVSDMKEDAESALKWSKWQFENAELTEEQKAEIGKLIETAEQTLPDAKHSNDFSKITKSLKKADGKIDKIEKDKQKNRE